MSSSTGSCSSAAITCLVPFFSRFDGAWTTSGRGVRSGGIGVNGRRSSRGGTTSACEPSRGHALLRPAGGGVVGADYLGVGALAVSEVGARLAELVVWEVVEDRL